MSNKAWEFLLTHEKRLRRFCLRAANGDVLKGDEYYSDILVEKIVDIVERHDGVRPLYTFVVANLRWYIFTDKKSKHQSLGDYDVAEEFFEREYLDDVLCIVEGLPDREKLLIKLRFEENLSFTEMAEKLNSTRTKTYYEFLAVMDRVSRAYFQSATKTKGK